ncbi:MAG: tetratricopeptide repeat protein [Longimicrobiales bacterium]|nr:tetratricopeptide repeat protein [Longimicrobiales bacterium]
MSRLTQLIREIHRRSLWQVLGIYGVGAWLAYEVILGLTEGGVLPGWFPGIAVGLFIVGLPVVLATAFVQEGIGGDSGRTDQEGSDRLPETSTTEVAAGPTDAPAEAGSPRAPSGAGELSRLDRLLTWRRAIAAGVFAFVFAGLVAVTASVLSPGAEAPDRERSIAVLPLENMSPDPDDEYFTDGIHEEIITRLFRIPDIRTLARASVMGFGADERPLPEIAEALDVSYLLVGSVRRSGERSRVSVALVAPRSGEQLWADTYDAAGTDVFAVQASIAENVAEALKAELTEGTRSRLTARPTTSATAYDDFLRARDAHLESYGQASLAEAIRLYERAIGADPEFAIAHAQLGMAHTQYYWFHYDHSDERLERARHHIDRALSLDPGLPEGHFALARFHYWGHLAYDDALRELEIAMEALPSNPEIPLTRGSVYRRAGRFDEAIRSYRAGIELDPRFWGSWWNLAETYWLTRRFDEAIAAVQKAADVGMNVSDAWTLKAKIRLRGYGDPAAALATLDSVPTGLATGEHRPGLVRVEAHSALGDFDSALAGIDSDTESQFLVRPAALVRGMIHRFAGRPSAAAAAMDTARQLLETLRERAPQDVRLMGALAIALAGLGQDAEALELVTEALDRLPPEREAWRGAVRVEEVAIVQAMTGRHEEAVENLRWLLSHPSPVAPASVQLDPVWDPLRDRRDFQALLDDG